jgi:hypothetical protein
MSDAIQAAADAVRAHIQAPDTATLHDMQQKVQDAQNQGASLQDIAAVNRDR